MIKIGILKEGKVPVDHRVPFTPTQCQEIQLQFESVKMVVQSSDIRSFSDQEYKDAGIEVVSDVSDCDILMGVKEVPVDQLIEGKKYFFFSHTIKKQPYNRKLLQEVLKKNIQLVDYECLVNEKGARVLGFGKFAGIVGAYNTFRMIAEKHDLHRLKPAHDCKDYEELKEELNQLQLPSMKIVASGGGRVASGIVEILDHLKVPRLSPDEFLQAENDQLAYCQIDCEDYNRHKEGKSWETSHFYAHPEEYESTFQPFAQKADTFISGHFWDPRSPRLFELSDIQSPNFAIQFIGDITCDIEGSVPTTVRSTEIPTPFYGFDKASLSETTVFAPESIAIMAVDNLPCELPRDASEHFGNRLIDEIIPDLLTDNKPITERGSITKEGKLCPRFDYLTDYAAGKE